MMLPLKLLSLTRMRILLSLATLLLTTACTGITELKAPELDVMSVKVLGGDLSGQRLLLHLNVINPNDRKLPIKGIVYQMQVAGVSFASGATERAFTVPAQGSTEFDLTMDADMAGLLFRVLGSGRKLDNVDYRLTGKVSLSSGLLRTIPFDKKGNISLR
jgi:LEA14-like dessication related protein